MDGEKKHEYPKNWLGVLLVIISAVSCSVGALFWKMADAGINAELFAGYFFQCLGVPFLIAAFKFGKLSALHPIMAFSYVVTVLLGVLVLKEQISALQALGLLLILAGVFLLSREKE
ncbi:MAG: EamA family transporter [Alphaproteobacteria bacterium]|nr:EamA family transporter [Alphaproteobacteria bacterium]